MFNPFFKCSAAVTLIALLSACAGSYNPQTSSLSQSDECVNLQRQMLFVNDLRTNNNQWNNQVTRQQLQQQFHDAHCYQVLSASRANQPSK